MDETMSGTGAGLLAFLDSAGKKGQLSGPVVKNLTIACREILQRVEGDGWGSADVRNLDVDEVMERFVNLRASRLKPESFDTYKSRLKRALSMYGEYLKDPGRWKPPARTRASVANSVRSRRDAVVSPPKPPAEKPQDGSPGVPAMMAYPFPLRRDGGVIFAELRLPTDLTGKEAERIAAHIKTLAVDEQLALPRPPRDDEQ